MSDFDIVEVPAAKVEHILRDLDRFSAPGFAEAARTVNQRLRAGEELSPEEIADVLGLSFETVSSMLAISLALRSGRPVMVYPTAPKRGH